MDDTSNENSQFSFKDDIFSQYDDNFATEDCLKSYVNNIGSEDAKMLEDSNSNKERIEPSVSQTRIIPTFGKPKNFKKDVKKPAVKAKKFVPPVKKTSNNEQNSAKSNITGKIQESLDQHLQPTPKTNLTNQAKPNMSQDSEGLNFTSQFIQNMDTMNIGLDMTQITQNINNIETYPNLLTTLDDSINIGRMDLFNTQQGIEKVDYTLENTSNTEGLPHSQGALKEKSTINNRVSLPTRMKSNILGSIISNSLNILDDEDIIPTENLSLEAHSDQESIKNLSQTQNQSFCSVTSLSKTYKNLDCNSFKNGGHRIPEGNEFLDLFKNHFCEKVKPVAMSTEFGDIGFNTKYSDFMKDFGLIDEQTEEEKETCLMIINMYPKENSILMKKLSK